MKKFITLIGIMALANSLIAQRETFDAVGIQIEPSYPLHIYEYNGQGTSLMIDAAPDANPNIYFRSNGTGVANIRYNDSGNDHLQIQTNGSSYTAIDISMNGLVGIGTTAPRYKLDVNGSIFSRGKLLGNCFTIDLDGGSSSYPKRITSQQVGGAATIELQTYSTPNEQLQTRVLLRGGGGNDIEFYDAEQSEFVHFDGDTRSVGIGTTSTFDYTLAVNGSIGAQGVVVESTSAWPDYVFSPDYKLRELSEVEKYVNTNKRLPDIPSNEEIDKNGINLGEMDAKLLQKVEELMLYIIEQDKKTQELLERLETVEYENKKLNETIRNFEFTK